MLQIFDLTRAVITKPLHSLARCALRWAMNLSWKTPVIITIGEPLAETAISTLQAAAWALIEDWPLEDGPALDHALVVCTAVMDGKRRPEEARTAFVAAASEAGILVRA